MRNNKLLLMTIIDVKHDRQSIFDVIKDQLDYVWRGLIKT